MNTLKPFLLASLSAFIIYCGYQVATAQTGSTRLLPTYAMTGEPNFTTARLQALYPDAYAQREFRRLDNTLTGLYDAPGKEGRGV
jgi:hypothetical protein